MARRLPTPIETERLVLRGPEPEAAPLVNEAIRESLAELAPWMPWAQQAPGVDETREHLQSQRERYLEGLDCSLMLWSRESGTFVGMCGLHPRPADPAWREIGYWIRTSCAGRGYATEAVRAVTARAFEALELEAIQIKTSRRNVASQRVALAAGFSRVAEIEDGRVDPGGFASSTILFLLRREAAGPAPGASDRMEE